MDHQLTVRNGTRENANGKEKTKTVSKQFSGYPSDACAIDESIKKKAVTNKILMELSYIHLYDNSYFSLNITDYIYYICT